MAMTPLRAGLLLIPVVLACCYCSADAAGPGAPADLKCEYQTNPEAIDTLSPRLSWRVNDARRGAVQSAREILVATSPNLLRPGKADVWDSGKVESNQSVNVAYSGRGLKSGAHYFWRIRTWDADGVASPYSESATFDVGLLGADDWTARWIEAKRVSDDADAAPRDWKHGKWIWHPTQKGDAATVWLRRSFELDARPEEALIRCTADNVFTLWVNGERIGSGDSWERSFDFDVSGKLVEGRNVIAVQAANQGGPCGFRLSARVSLPGETPMWVRSDSDWRAGDAQVTGWAGQDFDDSQWPAAAVLGAYGIEPWGRGGARGEAVRSTLARREFRVEAPVSRAVVRVSGLGAYELRINGEKVGRDYLTPGWTRFTNRVQYQTYEVTDLLQQGANAVAAILGSGWWHGRIGGERNQPGRDSLRLILQMDVEYADGSRDRIATGPGWRFHPSPILADSIYDGETYDARLECPGWDSAGFDDSEWAAGAPADQPIDTLVPQAKETIQAYETLRVKKITEPQPGVFVLDFGQNLVGWTRMKVRGKAGDTVVLRHAEVLKEDGNIYTENLRSARATDTYTLSGNGEETYEPRFTYHGFRYVELTGYPGRPSPDSFLALATSTATDMIGQFECSDDTINGIQHNIIWGQRGNMYAVPTDCPQRDERLGWTGDTQVFAPTSCYNASMVRLYGKWMRDIRDSQGADGAVRDVNPANGGGPASPAWGDACVIVPYWVWQHYGDTRIIEENWDCMTRWVEFISRQGPDGLQAREGYGDWIAVVGSPKKPISAAYQILDIKMLARMAKAIGKDEDAARYDAMVQPLTDLFNERYLDPETAQYEGGTQTANLLPLHFGLVPAELQKAVARNVADDIIKRRIHLSTGFLGTGYINPVLTEKGYHDLAWRLATQTTYPSWGYMNRAGATTIWELWNSDVAGPGMNSRNHFCLGSVGEWFFSALAGITPVEPGFSLIHIAPEPAGNLKWVKARLQTPYGPVVSNWELRDGDLHLSVSVPANTLAYVRIPTFGAEGVWISESGQTVFRLPDETRGTEHVEFRGTAADALLFRVGGGEYDFIAHGVGAPGSPDYGLPPEPPSITELSDDFSGAELDAAKWEVIDMGLESDEPSAIEATQTDGVLEFSGTTSVNYWAGKTLLSRGAFTVGRGQRLEVQIDRLMLEPVGSGARTSLWLWVDPGNYVMFSQDTEKNEWSYNINGQRGSGVRLAETGDLGQHAMKLVHDGTRVLMYLDGNKMGEARVRWREGIRIGLTGQARKNGDGLTARFDNLAARLAGRE